MIGRLYRSLPGPAPLRVVLVAAVVLAVLVALGWLFEMAGALLDTGGTIGA